MAGHSSAPPFSSVGSVALRATRGAHPTVRLDNFLKNTDVCYQHAEAPQQGDRFIRKMATYGQMRPSPSFTSEARVLRPMKAFTAIDMSTLPAPWNDPKGDPRELTFEIPAPPPEVDMEFIKLYQNHSLMLPSERYREHLQMKVAEKKWREDRDTVFMYKKRCRILERKHPEGILGVDGPMFPDTELYAKQREQYLMEAEHKLKCSEDRYNVLAEKKAADDAVTGLNYGTPAGHVRSQDICIQRKRVDPEVHPFRFLNTHERLFPQYVAEWDPERAYALRSHDTRGKSFDIVTGANNSVEYKVAKRWDQAPAELVNGPAYP